MGRSPESGSFIPEEGKTDIQKPQLKIKVIKKAEKVNFYSIKEEPSEEPDKQSLKDWTEDFKAVVALKGEEKKSAAQKANSDWDNLFKKPESEKTDQE